MPITSLLFTVGGVPFFDFEAPSILESLGGVQKYAEHDFPGGVRTQQVFGAFPHDVSWQGIFTGTDALVRWKLIDRMRVAGVEVPLSYGSTTLLGLVTEFRARPRHAWLVPYEMKFCPRIDIGQGTQLDEVLSVVALINSALGVLSTLVAIGEGLFAPGGSLLPSGNITSPVYAAMPPSMTGPTQAFINATLTALQNAFGNPAAMSPEDILSVQLAAQTLFGVAQPLSQSADPTVSSPASDTMGYVSTVLNAVTGVEASATVLNVTNPNLFTISAQYYGDAAQWQRISDANDLPPDPLPIGQFSLTIPPST